MAGLSWAVGYDPRGGEAGRITYRLDATEQTFDLKPERRKAGATFDRFGVFVRDPHDGERRRVLPRRPRRHHRPAEVTRNLRMRTRLLPLPLALLVAAAGAVPSPAADRDVAPPPRPALPPRIDPALADWTPRPATGKAEPWEKATDKDWVDARFRQMDTGPALNCTMDYPLGKAKQRVYKATVVKLSSAGGGREPAVTAGVVFDRCTMGLGAAWVGGYLEHSDRRFGLLNTPTPKGHVLFGVPAAAVLGVGKAPPVGKAPFTAPADPAQVKYRGMYLHGDRVVLAFAAGDREIAYTPRLEVRGRQREIIHTYQVMPGQIDVRNAQTNVDGIGWPASNETMRFTVHTGDILNSKADDVASLMKGGPKRWGEPIVTKLVRGDESGPVGLGNPPPVPQTPPAFAVDTLTIPYQNRFNALFFCTGLDFLPSGGNAPRVPPAPPSRQDGRIAVCTCHGDVWLVTVDEKAGTCSWQRYATGLYHPLGLKVIDGKVVVLERGQLTRLHDLNNDGEADFYECVNNDWHTGGGEHSYDTCLETDPQGNFYFFKTGDTDTPTGGCLMRVSKDGSKSEIFATGFRHPIGLGMSPTGIVTGADQEGNWMPATRIDEYKKGGFYGDMRAHHRATPPKTYDPPLCWLPREVDNSAGGQVWVPADAFGPLAGLPLHFSYGRCRPHVLLRQECDSGLSQGGVAALDVKFLSGVCRGRFASDGHLYVCGLNGWQTAARADGCLQRVRYTGKPLDVPVKMAVDGNTLRLTFSRPLDPKRATDPANFKAAWWNYRWSGEYGSKRWKVSDPNAEGQDEFGPRSAKLLGDGRTVELVFDKLQPVMQMQVGYNLLATDGRPTAGSVYLTIHSTGK